MVNQWNRMRKKLVGAANSSLPIIDSIIQRSGCRTGEEGKKKKRREKRREEKKRRKVLNIRWEKFRVLENIPSGNSLNSGRISESSKPFFTSHPILRGFCAVSADRSTRLKPANSILARSNILQTWYQRQYFTI